MGASLSRGGQQWIFDWLVEQTGRAAHFGGGGRGLLPKDVRSSAMVSKHMGKRALRVEALAHQAFEARHEITALDLYFKAANTYGLAQHSILKDSEEKRLLHSRSLQCFERVRELSPRPIERVEVSWSGTQVAGNLHLCNSGEPAPCVFFIPGCDMTKEMFPHPLSNPAADRGMHLFTIDGPGQGESNLRDIKLTVDNYESAAMAALEAVRKHEAVDAENVALLGFSFGSYWAIRTAAVAGEGIKAVAAPWSSICDKRHLMDEDGPWHKRLFAYLTGAADESELDDFVARSTLDHVLDTITAPVLLAVGEYDPRSPLDEVLEFFDGLSAPRELWIFEDQQHKAVLLPESRDAAWQVDILALALDWVMDRITDKPLDAAATIRRIGNRSGPTSEEGLGERHWFEPLLRDQ